MEVRGEHKRLSKDPLYHRLGLRLSLPNPQHTLQFRVQTIREITVQVDVIGIAATHVAGQ